MPAKRSRSTATEVTDGTAKVSKTARRETPSENVNAELCKIFEELMFYETKDGNKWAGLAYSKVLKALQSLTKKVTCRADVAKLSGVGKISADKMEEYLTTGKVAKLDQLKALHGELPKEMLGNVSSAKSGGTGKKKIGKFDSETNLPTKAQLKQMDEEAAKFETMSLDTLKQLLRMNRQVMSGTKPELVKRCSEGKVLGAIPICPLCGAGRLRFDLKTGIYQCPGYRDDDQFNPCIFRATNVKRTPWSESI